MRHPRCISIEQSSSIASIQSLQNYLLAEPSAGTLALCMLKSFAAGLDFCRLLYFLIQEDWLG